MKEIKEILFSKSVVVNTREIYPLSLDILDNMAAFGVVTEKRHEFETDGPKNRVHLFFDVEDAVDDHSSIIFSFMIDGESNGTGFLDVAVEGALSIKLSQTDTLGYRTFNSFYFVNMVPVLKSVMEKRIKHMEKFIEQKVERLNLKYA